MVVVDDEPLAREVIRNLLAEHDDVVVVAECRDGHEALEVIESLRPSLVFLDVQMPELDGFGVLHRLSPQHARAVVLVTAYDVAVRAFDHAVLDYLLKPFADARFQLALRRAMRYIAREETFSAEVARGSEQRYLDRMLVTIGRRSTIVPVDTIDWISAEDYYARLHVGRQAFLVRESLDSLEQRLDPLLFLRTHRAAIVNVSRVRELRRDSRLRQTLVLLSGAVVPVSERRRGAVTGRLRTMRP